jgi:hypothetical protein
MWIDRHAADRVDNPGGLRRIAIGVEVLIHPESAT